MIALLIHKVPEALGFGSYLVVKGAPRSTQLWNLLAFSVTSPLTALITYLSLRSMENDDNDLSLQYWTSIVLLFSVGTFLYVSSIHIMPEVFPRHSPHQSMPAINGEAGKNQVEAKTYGRSA